MTDRTFNVPASQASHDAPDAPDAPLAAGDHRRVLKALLEALLGFFAAESACTGPASPAGQLHQQLQQVHAEVSKAP